jgi:hypothetical protein
MGWLADGEGELGSAEAPGVPGPLVGAGGLAVPGSVVVPGPGVHDDAGLEVGTGADGSGPPTGPAALPSATPARANATIHAIG